jgi:hypothetical protein
MPAKAGSVNLWLSHLYHLYHRYRHHKLVLSNAEWDTKNY